MPSPQEVVSSTSLMYRFSSHSSLRDNLHASLQGESQDLRNKLIDVLLGGDAQDFNRTFTPDHDRVQLQQRHSPLLSLRPVLHAGGFNRGDTKNRVC